VEKTLGQILIEKLTPDELEQLTDSFEDGSLDSVFYDELFPEDKKNHPRKYADVDDDVANAQSAKQVKAIGKFYKHDIVQSRHDHAVRITKARLQSIIPILAENQILHLVDIAERGLPDCYNSFNDFLSDFWPDFSWTHVKAIPEVAAVLIDSRFKKIVPILKETWGIDMEKVLRDGIKVFQAEEI